MALHRLPRRPPGVWRRADGCVHLTIDNLAAHVDDWLDTYRPDNWYTEMDRVIGGAAWKPVRSPYLARRAYVCQLHYDLGGRRICATRAL